MPEPTSQKYIVFPSDVTKNYPAYLEITLKTLAGGNFISQLKNELINTAKSAISFSTDVAAVFGKTAAEVIGGSLGVVDINADSVANAFSKFTDLMKPESSNYFQGTPKLTFATYIPSDFESSIVSNWSEGELFGGINSVLNNLDKIPFAGSLIGAAYNALKNNASALSHTAITPKLIKMYQPSFYDFTLNLTYNMDSPEDAKKFLTIMRIFQESQRADMKYNSEELYSFPAIFDIRVVISSEYQSNTSTIISTKGDNSLNLWNHITSQKGYGLTRITVTPKSGNGTDMKFRSDGTNSEYNVSMSFTSLRRMFGQDSVSNRIDNLTERL